MLVDDRGLLSLVRLMRDSSPARAAGNKDRDRDDDDETGQCGRIINAANFFERLGLRENLIESAEVRRAYRSVALKVHPDKCTDKRATEAFQLLSEAFDTLHNKTSQQEYLQRARRHDSGSGGGSSKGKRKPRQRWYQRRSWEDIERHLVQREVAEAALRQSFMSSVRNKFQERKTRGQLAQAERTAYDLDEKAGFESDFAPASSEAGSEEVSKIQNSA